MRFELEFEIRIETWFNDLEFVSYALKTRNRWKKSADRKAGHTNERGSIISTYPEDQISGPHDWKDITRQWDERVHLHTVGLGTPAFQGQALNAFTLAEIHASLLSQLSLGSGRAFSRRSMTISWRISAIRLACRAARKVVLHECCLSLHVRMETTPSLVCMLAWCNTIHFVAIID
jgi:hypothetical protein